VHFCSLMRFLSACCTHKPTVVSLLLDMKVFLTSGTGYVGAAIAERLVAAGHHVGRPTALFVAATEAASVVAIVRLVCMDARLAAI
jgi:NAD(P)-dependent dehydrogenase (short-subunit alcohol dehydrogenase family)